ncbi:snRNA-activating protein complex subunit 4 [Clarias gariepinus]|uniref:snRNA-activating protein complex subunit 4 n=1 Tax=Clarias gariepinus TaxID=13013 RepID=UPI00234D7AE0|nr:snRNA-activating protein complex subunit 4 [Clarias gariepinus]XP_053337483.1 snRNA-activating protein complex subunit 4 [Clarias gariepinus]XP_053337484.1 snRNA-activating protein complex subunit 4 [Clarias gariepinus]XP_053337485.1 snRNA-activating protein complex subunit 4 [Clarias gariepinus]
MASEDLLAQRNKLQHQILALEQTLGNDQNIVDLLSSDNDSAEESDDSGHAQDNVAHENLEAERQQIQKEIEELERTLGADAALVDALTDSEHGSVIDSGGEKSDDDLDLPQDLETCLQMNLVYQEVLKEKLADLEKLLKENREQQKDLEEQLSGPSYVNPGLPHLKLFLGSFMKPYFKDKLTGLGPPANEETKERLTNGTKPCDEKTIRRWEPWQKTLLINSVVTDTMKRMLQPKLSKMEYLTAKMAKAKEPEKEELQNQITLLEKDIERIRSLKEDQLYGDRNGDHDWDKIANIDFEGFRQPDDLMRFWQNYLHPSINKSTWNQEEIAKLAEVAEKHNYCHWDQIAESLGTNRTAFMCFQTYQRYISKCFRKRAWTKEEDQVFRDLVDKMRIGSFIPYTQISYFMEGRDSSQLIYRWTCVLDPSIKKGPWTKEEDQLLLKAVKKYGCKEWWKIRLEVPGRTDNACRDRYLDCLRDDIKRGAWSDEEVELLKQLVEKHGVGKWAKIASEIPNRVDSQCLNKWKWMMQLANRKGKRKRRRRKTSASGAPQLKRRRLRRKKVSKEEFGTESDTSEDEKEQVPYMDDVVEEEAVVEENVSVDEDCRLEYVQPDMKEWIPARRNNLGHSFGNLKTTWVRLPTEAEGCDSGSVHITVLDKLGNAVKTYVGMEPPALQKWNSSNEHAMIMVSECDIKSMLISMKASVIKARTPKTKTSSSSCTNQNSAETNEEVDKSKMESGQRKRQKPITKAVATKQLNYDLMLAITPWVGNVVMPLSFRERQVCEADVVRNRAADVPLLVSPVFLFFLQALKVDVDGCKKVIEARKNKVSMTPGPESRPDSVKKPTTGSRRRGNTVADLLAKRTEQRKRYRSLQSPVFVDSLLFPQTAKIAIPRRPQPQKKTKQVMQPVNQKQNAAVIPQTFATSHNVTQGILPLLQLSDTSKNYPPVVLLAMPVNSGGATESASCPTTSASTTKPPTETVENVSAPKRKHKPTIKAQALMENKRDKLSKKKQLEKNKSRAAAKQQKGSVPQTVTVLPQTTAWIVTPAGLMPVAGIQVQAPGISGPQNNLQMVFQPPVIVNPSTSVTLDDGLKLSNPAPDIPGNNIISQTSGSNRGENSRPSSVSDNTNVSSFPSSSNFPSVNSGAVAKKPGVLQALSGTNMPTSITGSVAQVTSFETACHENKPVTTTNPMSSLVRDSSSSVGASQNLTESCISDTTDSIPKVYAATSTCVPSAHPLNISVSGTVSGPQSQHHVSEVQPIIVNQNGSLAPINPSGACLINNAPLTPTANFTRVLTNSTSPNISVAEPCLIKNATPTSTANVPPPNSTITKIDMTVPPYSTNSPATSSSYLIIPTSASPSVLNAIPPSSIVNSSVPISVGGHPTDQLCVNPAITPMNTNCQFPPQTMVQQMTSQAKKQPVQGEVTTPNPTPKPITFDPSLMFLEPPSQVNNWRRGMGGIILPNLKDKIPYLPPFVSSINTLTTLLKGRDSLLMSAVQLLPEEHRDSSDDEAKIAAVRKIVSERFKTNQAYLLMKARFLSCFTLPALLATINPNKESTDDLDQEDDMDKVEPKLFGDEAQPLGSLLNVEEGELTATQFPGVEPRNDNHISATI